MKIRNGLQIIGMIEAIIERYDIKRIHLGVVLGAKKDGSRAGKYAKYKSFITHLKNNRIYLSHLKKLASFFGSTVEHFMIEGEELRHSVEGGYMNVGGNNSGSMYRARDVTLAPGNNLNIIEKLKNLSPEKQKAVQNMIETFNE